MELREKVEALAFELHRLDDGERSFVDLLEEALARAHLTLVSAVQPMNLGHSIKVRPD